MNKADLRQTLVEDLSEQMMNRVQDIAANQDDVFNFLWEIAIENHYPASWRAAWIYSKVVDKRPHLALKHLHLIPQYLLSFNHDGQKRELLKVVLLFPLQNQDMGRLLKICFDWLANPKESASVRVHSMQIVYEISCIETDLQPELKLQILQLLPDADAGLKNRSQKILEKLSHIDVWNRM